MLRSKVWRPGFVFTQVGARVVSDHRPLPSQDGRRLRWLDGDGLKGGTYRLDRGEVRLVRSRPEERPETRAATKWAPEGAFCFRAFRRSTPLWRGREMKAAPRARLFPGPMNHACINDADVMRA